MTVSCDICGGKYQDTRGLSSHMRNKHKDFKPDDSNELELLPQVQGVNMTPLKIPINPMDTKVDIAYKEAIADDDEEEDIHELINQVKKLKLKRKIKKLKMSMKRIDEEHEEERQEKENQLLKTFGILDEDEDDDEKPEVKDNTDAQAMQVFEKIIPYLNQVQPKQPIKKDVF